MLINKWLELSIRSIAASLLFIAAAVLISWISPVLTMEQQENFMMAMMHAMVNSPMCSEAVHPQVTQVLMISFVVLLLIFIPASVYVGSRLRKGWMDNGE